MRTEKNKAANFHMKGTVPSAFHMSLCHLILSLPHAVGISLSNRAGARTQGLLTPEFTFLNKHYAPFTQRDTVIPGIQLGFTKNKPCLNFITPLNGTSKLTNLRNRIDPISAKN